MIRRNAGIHGYRNSVKSSGLIVDPVNPSLLHASRRSLSGIHCPIRKLRAEEERVVSENN